MRTSHKANYRKNGPALRAAKEIQRLLATARSDAPTATERAFAKAVTR
jgi:hypothetical protein